MKLRSSSIQSGILEEGRKNTQLTDKQIAAFIRLVAEEEQVDLMEMLSVLVAPNVIREIRKEIKFQNS